MPSKKKKYNARFPAGRIKKIMQSDEEVGKVAQAVPIIISRTLELFVESMLTKTMRITNARNAKTLSPSHLKQCIMSENRFDFLRELVKNVPDINVAEEQMLFENASPSIATPASLPSTTSNSINENIQSTSGSAGVNTSIINNNQFKNTLQQSLSVSNDDTNSIKNGNKRINTQTTTIPLAALTSQPMKSAWQYTKQQSLDCGSNYSLSTHTVTNSATSLSSSLASSSTSQINKIINPNYYTEISDTSVIRHTSNSQDINCISTEKCISGDNIDCIVRPPKLARFDSAPANLSQSTSINNVSLSNNATEEMTPLLKIDLSNMTFGSKDIDDSRSANSIMLSTLNVSQKRQLLPPLTPISTHHIEHYNIPITKNVTTQHLNLNSLDALSSTVPSTSGTPTTILQPSIVNSDICNAPLVKINYCDLLNEGNNNFSPTSNSSPSSLLINANLSATPSPTPSSSLSEPLICTASSATSIKSKTPTNNCKSTNIFRSFSSKTSNLLEMDEDYDNI